MTPHEITVPPTCICGDLLCELPYGLCHCGCGGKTNISPRTDTGSGCKKGMPKRFIGKHVNGSRPIYEVAKPFKIDGGLCRIIHLTKGAVAIVDAAEYERLWNHNWFAMKKGKAYYAARNPPRVNGVRYKRVYMHSAILNTPEGEQGDHKFRNTLDNRRSQLRNCAERENKINVSSPGNKNGYRGVKRAKYGYTASISVNNQSKYLGHFKAAIMAAITYDAEAIKQFGDFAVLNFPKGSTT